MLKKITPAVLEWDEQGQPQSSGYGDLYFSKENGLEETKHVFLNGNNLDSRWQKLNDGDLFVIGETGFGTGLNLLAAAQLWLETAHDGAILQFVSTEQHPVALNDLKKVHQQWPELQPLAKSLIQHYPILAPGYHRFYLAQNIEVTLIFDEVESGLTSLCPPLEPKLWDHKPYAVDAWFLDGFSPAKNPSMWRNELFPLIHRLSKEETTLATFTAAGDVKRNLEKWGFNVSKLPGFGRKREMIQAVYENHHPTNLNELRTDYKTPIPCWSIPTPQISIEKESIAIIGAGIAGATLASALAKRCKVVQVYEQGESTNGASNISQIALYAKLSPDHGELEDFALAAMPFSQRYYQKLIASHTETDLGNLCGLVQLPRNDDELRKMQKISDRLAHCSEFVKLLSAAELSDIAGIAIASSGLYFPKSGWLNGENVCQRLLEHPNVQVDYQTNLLSIDRHDDGWQLHFQNGQTAIHQQIIFCNAQQAQEFEILNWLPTRPIRGQVSFFDEGALPHLASVVCRDIQLTPAAHGLISSGSTYDLDNNRVLVTEEDHQRNINKLQDLVDHELEQALQAHSGQSGVRCTTPDYLPICGPIAKKPAFLEAFSPLRKDAKLPLPIPGPIEPGLFINIGFGSRGFSYAPLCAESLAAQICGHMPPLPSDLRQAIHPSRFLFRGLKRGKY